MWVVAIGIGSNERQLVLTATPAPRLIIKGDSDEKAIKGADSKSGQD